MDANGKPIYSKTMIYDWLDEIREMGLRQSFLNLNNDTDTAEDETL